ncbi:MAG: type transport system permease protein [Thermodesulfobacteriota bacterium]|nr:type transport system permease protein [Thermodesulfobacteriota bacterium]
MRDLFRLIRPRLQGLRNQMTRSGASGKKRALIMGGLGIAFCAGMFAGSCRVLIYFQSVEMIGDLLARQLLSMALLTFFSLLIFSSIITALSNLYLSKDLELCHSMPVSVETLFASRSLYTFVDSSWMVIFFGLPVFLAYGYVYRPGPIFYFSLVHMNVAMAVIACFVGILLTMALVHVFPAQRTRDIILLLSILLVVALYLLFRLLRPERLVNPEAFFTVAQYVSALKAPDSPYLPTHWVAETLWGHLSGGQGRGYLLEMLLAWSTAGSAVVINVWVARRIYFRGFSKSQEAKKRRAGGGRLLDLLILGATKPFGRDLAAIIGKDIRVFFRDNTQWSQLLLLGALIVVYLYNFSVLPLDKSPMRLDFLQNQLAFLNMGLAGFVLSAICARFVFTAVSAEGEAYWIIRTSPLMLRRYLWGKYLFFLFPVLILAEFLTIATNLLLEVTLFMMILSTITIGLMVFGIVALGIGFGAMYPRFNHENISQVATGFGGFLYMVVSAVFIALVIILEAGPVYILFMAGVRGSVISTLEWLFITLSFAAVVLINWAAVFRPMKMGLKALQEYE